MPVQQHSRRLSPPPMLALAVLALVIATLSPPLARADEVGKPGLQANDLLRQAVAKEQNAANSEYFAWMDRVQKPHGSITKFMVNTPQGILSRTVAIDDQPLSADERRQDDERDNRLLDAEKMREKAKKQQEDQQHIERLLLALPDAFDCDYSSASHEERSLLMECSPNPKFSPPNYESQVLLGMKAEIEIDREEKRITRIAGTLFKDVTFGWGLLARLDRGGRIEINQSKVTGKHWGITHMQLDFDGRLIVVKPLHMEETESSWNYRPVPAMSVAQALEFLRSNAGASPR
jgi:hypothetical protein